MITITSDSMDELNRVYRKLKNDYHAQEEIKLDQSQLVYRLDLKREELRPIIKNLADKMLDFCEELSDCDPLTISSLETFLQDYSKKYPMVQQLFDQWNSVSLPQRKILIEYIGDEMKTSFNG